MVYSSAEVTVNAKTGRIQKEQTSVGKRSQINFEPPHIVRKCTFYATSFHKKKKRRDSLNEALLVPSNAKTR